MDDGIHQRFAALQWEGLRDYQEDDFGFLDARDSDPASAAHTVIMVADGMGGHNNGARASQLATEAFINSYQHNAGADIPARLHTALLHSNEVLAENIRANPELEGMGTTLVAAVIRDSSLHWISVGDSPLWLLRQGELLRLNADHSMAPLLADMVASGKLSAEEAASDPNRHSLLSALMGDSVELIDQSAQALPLLPDDLILLASDGILTLDEATLLTCLEKNRIKPVQEIAEQLLNQVKKAGRPGQDNLTLALYRPETGDAASVAASHSIPAGPAVKDARHFPSALYAFIGGGLLVLLIVLVLLWLNGDSGTSAEAPGAAAPVAGSSESLAPEAAPAPAAAPGTPSLQEPADSQMPAAGEGEKDPNPPLAANIDGVNGREGSQAGERGASRGSNIESPAEGAVNDAVKDPDAADKE